MTLLDDVQEYFGTKDLYEVLKVPKDSSQNEIKKAYRKASLKIHPDRVEEENKEAATKKFQVLAQVHFVLNDPENRKMYDDHGIICNEDSLDSQADWESYWRLLFPKISDKDIDAFYKKYEGSKEEEDDLIALYNRFKGNLNLIMETHISYDEERTVAHLNRLIEEGRVEKLDAFVNESASKKKERTRKIRSERKAAEKRSKKTKEKGENIGDLTALIRNRAQNFDSMIANLEAKYAGSGGSSRGTKRKRTKD